MAGVRTLVCALAVVACSHGDPGRAERTTQVSACADAIEKAGSAAPGEQAAIVARGCVAACGGLAEWAAARDEDTYRPGVFVDRDGAPPTVVPLVEGCHPGCNARIIAGTTPAANRWAALAQACPALVPSGDLASEEAVAIGDVARWLGGSVRAGLADPQLPVRLEHVGATATFVLPLPAQPRAPASRFRSPSEARQFVTVGDPIRIGAVPHVRIVDGRLDPVAVPGEWPGQAVDLDQLAVVLGEHGAQLAQIGGTPSTVPIVIADASTPLTRLFEVVTRLGVAQAEIAVAGDVTFAHPVLLERRGMHVATPEIDLEATDIRLRGFGDDRVTDWAHLDAELDNFAAMNAPVRALELHPLPDTTVADLVKLMDACVVGRVSVIQFIPTGP